jgi:hypothetical protein
MGVGSASASRLPQATAAAPPLLSVAIISGSALAYEILLTRIFAIVHWHHLVAVAISLALLGYGASGTFLFLVREQLQRHLAAAYVGNAWLFAVATLACTALAQHFTFDPQALAWHPQALIPMAAAFLLLAIPFFAAANCIGLILTQYRDGIGTVYAVDLVGAGIGAVAILLGLALLPPDGLLPGILAGGMLAAVLAAHHLGWHPLATTVACALSLFATLAVIPAGISPAPHKDLSRAMATKGAELITDLHGIDGVAVVVGNDTVPLRTAPGMSLQTLTTPPPQLAIFVDGDASGTLPDFRAGAEASAYLASLLSALPYVVHPQAEHVAIVNAGSGTSVQQAIVMGAGKVSAVEPNQLLSDLACRRFGDRQPEVCDPGSVAWDVRSARTFMAAGGPVFDIIKLSLGGEPAGTDALAIDYDVTREAMAGYLGRLKADGLIAIEGPARAPPRLSLRILNTARSALLESGIDRPDLHLAMLRGWQRFIVLAGRTPLDAEATERLRRFSRDHGFDLVWIPGMQREEANRFQRLAAPYFHDTAVAILDQDAAGYAFRLQVITDDRPFAHYSTTWSALADALISANPRERSQLDTGMLAAVAILTMVAVAAVVLILVPLAWLRVPGHRVPPRGMTSRTLLYFGLIGVAFLFTEIAWIQRLQLFLGHPVIATTAVLAGFLLFAGAGSAWSQARQTSDTRLLVVATTGITAFALLFVVAMPWLLEQFSGLHAAWRVVIAIMLLAPLAFAMGVPFPLALRHLGACAPMLVPWAWGINGAASVVAAASAPLLAAEIGFTGLTLTAAVAYLALPAIGLTRSR